MNYVQRAKKKAKMFAGKQAIGRMARMLANASDENLIKLTRLIERFMITDMQKR